MWNIVDPERIICTFFRFYLSHLEHTNSAFHKERSKKNQLVCSHCMFVCIDTGPPIYNSQFYTFQTKFCAGRHTSLVSWLHSNGVNNRKKMLSLERFTKRKKKQKCMCVCKTILRKNLLSLTTKQQNKRKMFFLSLLLLLFFKLCGGCFVLCSSIV